MQTVKMDEELWKALLAPISEDAPCGEHLVYDMVYDEIKEARSEEDSTLPQGVWQRDLKKADWGKVERLCLSALTTRTKDLQIAAWLMEAWFMQSGAQGLQIGLKLLSDLASAFWEGVHPTLREDDPEYRLSPFDWCNEKLEERVRFVVLTKPTDVTLLPLTYADYLKAQQNDNIAKRDIKIAKEQEKAGEITLVDFRRCVTMTQSSFYHDLHGQLQGSLAQVMGVESFIEQKLPSYPGILVKFRATLKDLLTFVAKTLDERHESVDLDQGVSNESGDAATKAARMSVGPIKTREQAYQVLAQAADFLARLEPHSPTPFLVRRAINWGSMNLTDLLQEIVADPNDFRQIMQLLGMSRKEENH